MYDMRYEYGIRITESSLKSDYCDLCSAEYGKCSACKISDLTSKICEAKLKRKEG